MTIQKSIFILSAVGLLMLFSCEKQEDVTVKYIATNAVSEFHLSYRLPSGALQSENITASSIQDQWSYSFTAQQGDIVYLSGNYKDINSGLKLLILMDGKVYKQASTVGDTINFVIVSGVVPIE
jgi:hypothetical protein